MEIDQLLDEVGLRMVVDNPEEEYKTFSVYNNANECVVVLSCPQYLLYWTMGYRTAMVAGIRG